LLSEQTRPHKDLDIIMFLDDVVHMRELLGRAGYGLKEIWSENRLAVDAQGIETPTAFVLRDSTGREVDAHALRLDDRGYGIPVWANDEGLVFTPDDLAGEGMIAGVAVHCLSPAMQLICHTGYDLPDVQLRDLDLFRARFGIEQPTDLSRFRHADSD
jgi:lincosamide nucleotidyltransferase A/C/D/E